VLVRFAVKDTGIGISKEAMCRLFQPFSQADSSMTRKYGGTGLGLAISKRLTELMGGSIGVESEQGRGSTFFLTLPFAPASGAPGKPVTLPSSTRAEIRGKRALVVDDNATNRKIFKHYLEAWEMRMSEAETGEEALRLLREAAASGDPFNILFTDLQMPEMDGISLARSVRGDPLLSTIPMLLLSSLGERGYAAAAKEAGIVACLVKPVRKAHLRRLTATILAPGFSVDEKLRDDAAAKRKDLGADKRGRVLIAEDNVVNQRVAVRIMEKLGFRAEVAANGLEAVDAAIETPYDAILMDCLMPECDGFEATARIRKGEGAERRTIIIALTANAIQGDRERCLAAGMDDYLSKPFKSADLDGMLRKWRVGEAVPAARSERCRTATPIEAEQ